MSDVSNHKRIEWIDSIRGIAIFLVLLGHCCPNCYEFFLISSPLKMPLFFVITGFVFNPRGGDMVQFIKNLLIKIVVPWLLLGLIPIAFSIPIKGFNYFFHYFLKMLSGESIWFMPCLIYAELCWFLIRNYISQDRSIVIASFIFSVLGICLGNYHILDYGMVNRALAVQSFIALGYLFRKFLPKIKTLSWIYVAMLAILYVSLTILSFYRYPGQTIDVHTNTYYNPILCFVLIVSGCSTLFFTFCKFNLHPRWLTYVGQNTLLLYIWSPYVILLFHKLLSKVNVIDSDSFFIALLITIFTCLICSMISIVVNKYLPFLVGKKYVR